jgi:MFS superfamily sulfate permease-like transporter
MLAATQFAKAVNSSDPYDYIIPAATLAFLVGFFLMIAAILRLGFLANFISLPVLTGFKAGIGVVIFVGQLGKVLGISIPKGPFLQTIYNLATNLGQTHLPTLLLSILTLAVLVLLPRFAPRVPVALLAVAGGILASALLGLEGQGVSLVGEISSGLPNPKLLHW